MVIFKREKVLLNRTYKIAAVYEQIRSHSYFAAFFHTQFSWLAWAKYFSNRGVVVYTGLEYLGKKIHKMTIRKYLLIKCVSKSC